MLHPVPDASIWKKSAALQSPVYVPLIAIDSPASQLADEPPLQTGVMDADVRVHAGAVVTVNSFESDSPVSAKSPSLFSSIQAKYVYVPAIAGAVNAVPAHPVSPDMQELTCVPEHDPDLNEIVLPEHDVRPEADGVTLPDAVTVDGKVKATEPEHAAAALTVNVNVVVRVKEPPVPVIVIECIPVDIKGSVAIVTADMHVEVHIPGVNSQETPAGPVHVSVTVPEPVIVTVSEIGDVELPCVTVAELGLGVDNEKSKAVGGGGAPPDTMLSGYLNMTEPL